MYDPSRVGLRQGIRELRGNRQGFTDLEGLVPDSTRQCLTLDVLHYNEALATICADFVNMADVRMVKRRRGLGLSYKPLLSLLVGHDFGSQEFNSDLTRQARVFCEVHLSHCAFPE